MTLRISAGLAILVGLFLAYETWVGMSYASRYGMEGQETFVVEHFALQWAFVAALIVGAALALWRGWRVLLAAAWGMLLGLDAPHLIRPAIPPAALVSHVLSRGGDVHVPGVDPALLVIVLIALVGLVLCGVFELTSER